jgi:hypothetical protein
MEKQTSNDKSVKTPMLPEPSGDNKSSLLLPQVQTNHRLTLVKSTPTSGNKHLRHQLPHSSDANIIYLVPTDCARETSSGISSVTDSKSIIHHKPTWEPLLPLSTTSKIPQWSDVSKQTSASLLLRSKKEILDTADPQQVLTPEADWSVLASDVVDRVPLTRWLKKVEAKMK